MHVISFGCNLGVLDDINILITLHSNRVKHLPK